EIITSLENRPILTVGEADGFCENGGMIQFYTEKNKIKLEINSEASRLASLNISSKLLAVAKTK
ncbi:MAG: YfiR family protein, partial [bacterium]